MYTKSNKDEDKDNKIIINESVNDTEYFDKASVVEKHELKKIGILKYIRDSLKAWMDEEQNKMLKLLMVVLIVLVLTMTYYFHTTVKEVISYLSEWKIVLCFNIDNNLF